MKYIKGPDFPTGGIIQGIDGIKKLMNQVKVELCSSFYKKVEERNFTQWT